MATKTKKNVKTIATKKTAKVATTKAAPVSAPVAAPVKSDDGIKRSEFYAAMAKLQKTNMEFIEKLTGMVARGQSGASVDSAAIDPKLGALVVEQYKLGLKIAQYRAETATDDLGQKLAVSLVKRLQENMIKDGASVDGFRSITRSLYEIAKKYSV